MLPGDWNISRTLVNNNSIFGPKTQRKLNLIIRICVINIRNGFSSLFSGCFLFGFLFLPHFFSVVSFFYPVDVRWVLTRESLVNWYKFDYVWLICALSLFVFLICAVSIFRLSWKRVAQQQQQRIKNQKTNNFVTHTNNE